MLHLIVVLLLAINGTVFSWEGKNEHFSVTIALEGEKIALCDHLGIHFSVFHPKGMVIDVDHLKENLLLNGSPGGSPFLLASEEVNVKGEQTDVTFFLSPIYVGRFPIAPGEIVLNDSEKKQKSFIVSPIFWVDVENVSEGEESGFVEAPLLPLDDPYPIILSEENRPLVMKEERAAEWPQVFLYRAKGLQLAFSVFVFSLVLGFLYVVMEKKN